MELKRIGANLNIVGKKAKVNIVGSVGDFKDNGSNIVIGNIAKAKSDSYIVNSPGEYEVDDVFIYVLDTDSDQKPDLYSVFIDQIQITFLLDSLTNIQEKYLEMLGVTNILVMEIFDSEDLIKKIELVRKFDPAVFIPISKSKDLDKKVINELGVENIEGISKVKYEYSYFADNELPLSVILLNQN